MSREPSVCIKALWMCVMGAARHGLSPEEVCSLLQLDPAILSDAHARLPHSLVVRAYEEIPRRCGSENFGLLTSEQLAPTNFNLIDYAILHCRTAGEVMQVLLRYQRLLHDSNDIRLEINGGTARVLHRFKVGVGPRHFVESILVMWTSRLQLLFRQPVRFEEVFFQHAAPADTSDHERILHGPVRFQAPFNGIAFDARLLDEPVQHADPGLGLLLKQHAEELLAKLPPLDEFRDQLRRQVMAGLDEGVPTLASVAKGLAMSTRTLQRRLQEEGTSFQEFVDEVRRELALQYVQDPRQTLSDIAFRLGFSEHSSFHRSFRRWTGSTPAQYRKQRLLAS